MRDLLVRVGRYPCGSLDVEVSSSGLAIADRRHMPHMPHHLSIITITPDQPDGAANTSDVFAPWDTVRSFVASNTTMPEFSRLAHLSSFERRHSVRRAMSNVSSVLNHRRSSHDRRSSDDRHDRTGKWLLADVFCTLTDIIMHLVCQLAYMNNMPVCLASMQLMHRRPGEYTACFWVMTAHSPCSNAGHCSAPFCQV